MTRGEEQSGKLAATLEEYRDKMAAIGHIRSAQKGRVLHRCVHNMRSWLLSFSEKADLEKKLKVAAEARKQLEEQSLRREQRLKEKEEALAKAEEIMASKDRVILDGLSCRRPPPDGAHPPAHVTAETEVQSHFSSVLRSSEERIRDLQEALDKREHLLKTYDQKLETMMSAHREELGALQEQLHSQARRSLDLHKQIAKVRRDPPLADHSGIPARGGGA